MPIYQKWAGWVYRFHLDSQYLQKFVKYSIKIKKIKFKISKSNKEELKVIESDVSKKFGDLKILFFYRLDQVLEFQCLA